MTTPDKDTIFRLTKELSDSKAERDRLAGELEQLKEGKESWGNEFAAVMMLKQDIDELKEQLAQVTKERANLKMTLDTAIKSRNDAWGVYGELQSQAAQLATLRLALQWYGEHEHNGGKGPHIAREALEAPSNHYEEKLKKLVSALEAISHMMPDEREMEAHKYAQNALAEWKGEK